jgi:hypothetical protein
MSPTPVPAYCSFGPLPLPQPLCWHFRDRGRCPWENKCRFAHVFATAGDSVVPATHEKRKELLYWLHRMHPDESEYALLVKTLDAHGFRRAMTADEKMRAVLLWSGSSTLPSVQVDGLVMRSNCVANRLPNGIGAWITQKDLLSTSLRRKGQACLAPLTFLLPLEFPHLLRHLEGGCTPTLADWNKSEQGQAAWIVKPMNSGLITHCIIFNRNPTPRAL